MAKWIIINELLKNGGGGGYPTPQGCGERAELIVLTMLIVSGFILLVLLVLSIIF